MEERIVRIAAGSGGLIDSAIGLVQHLGADPAPDYLVFDHLGEGMMGALALQQRQSPGSGWSQTFLDMHVGPWLAEIAAKGIRVVTNAGGLNPHGLAARLREACEALGLSLPVGVVTGDDLRAMIPQLAAEGHREMFDQSEWPEGMLSANAYLGAFPIAEALARGARIVVTGRVVDSALALGPLVHEFGWRREDYDLLAMGTLAGHLVECGAQASGGTFTDWLDVEDAGNIGFPVAECRADGRFVLTKPPGTGGLVSFATVAEQVLYEVSDPAAYLVPDVACDFTGVTLTEAGPDRVEVAGARGRAPTGRYKVCATSLDGWKATGIVPVFGHDAATKARRTAEAVFARARRVTEALGLPYPRLEQVELIGAGEMVKGGEGASGNAANPAREVLARLVYHSASQRAAQILAFECNTACLNGSAGTLPFVGAAAAPLMPLFSFSLPRDRVTISVTVEGETTRLAPETAWPAPDRWGPVLPSPPVPRSRETCDASVPLRALAWARSGDKGNLYNVGVIARRPAWLAFIRAALTPEAVGDWMRHTFDDPEVRRVSRYEVPGIHALNFVLHASLSGSNGTSIRLDTNAKSMAQQVLEMPVPVPRAVAEEAGAD